MARLLRSRPDVVATWDDTQVALHWWQLCPTGKVKREVDGQWIKVQAEPTEFELSAGKPLVRGEEERCQEIG